MIPTGVSDSPMEQKTRGKKERKFFFKEGKKRVNERKKKSERKEKKKKLLVWDWSGLPVWPLYIQIPKIFLLLLGYHLDHLLWIHLEIAICCIPCLHIKTHQDIWIFRVFGKLMLVASYRGQVVLKQVENNKFSISSFPWLVSDSVPFPSDNVGP